MSERIEWMKRIYKTAVRKELEWKPIYPNNMPCNGMEGVYTDMFFEQDGSYTYFKFSIQYCAKCDENGLTRRDEGIRYYVLHELRRSNLEERFEIPTPSDETDVLHDNLALFVNNYGRFRYVFDDVETAKSVVANELLQYIYPFTYLLDDDEGEEWNRFLREQNNGRNEP